MKIRTGFVSNSSSSSFIVVGFKVPQSESEKYEDDVYDTDEENNECIVGEGIIRFSECEIDDAPFENIIKAYTKMKAKYPDQEIKIIGGSIYG